MMFHPLNYNFYDAQISKFTRLDFVGSGMGGKKCRFRKWGSQMSDYARHGRWGKTVSFLYVIDEGSLFEAQFKSGGQGDCCEV